jgi:signal transduction histidine kinase
MFDPDDPGGPGDSAAVQRLWLVAHDLKNSFSLMSHAFHDLPRHLDRGQPAKQAYGELRSLLTHVDFLATVLIDSLHVQAAGRAAIALNDFIAERESSLRRTLGPGIALNIRLSATGGLVLATTQELERLLVALVSNACLAMPDGGEVTIGTCWLDHAAGTAHPGAWPRRYVRLLISDTGDGLDRAGQLRLLDPIPGDVSAKDAERDSVVSAVRRLNGWLIVESEEGGGTRVNVFLPGVAEPPEFDLNQPPS